MAQGTSYDYDAAFYRTIRPGVKRSAKVLVPLLLELLGWDTPRSYSMIDVGCGEGWWAHEFARHDVGTAVGIDGAYVQGSPLGEDFAAADLSRPLAYCTALGTTLPGSYDLALSLEVAEHLPPRRAAGFVDDLCTLAPLVVFSAAVPGQGGHGHINCRPQSFWAAHFESRGYTVTGGVRWKIWDDGRVAPWYRQNLLVAVDIERAKFGGLFPPILMDRAPLDVLHPDCRS